MTKRKRQPTLLSGTVDSILAEIDNGREQALVWAEARAVLLDEEPYKRFMAAYQELDYMSRKREPLESLCKTAEIDPAQFLADFAFMSAKYAKLHVEVLKASHMPEVVRTSLLEAQKTDGWNDRHALLQQEGVHHAPKAANINVSQTVQSGTVLSFEDEARLLNESLERPALPEATTEFVDAEFSEVKKKVEVAA